MDTCGCVSRDALDKVIPYTDVFLYDLKAYDSDVHKMCTGLPNDIILDNLRYLDSIGKAVEIRIPFVPGYNDGEIEKIAKFLATLKSITKIRVLPYHNYAASKYRSLDMPCDMPPRIPTAEELQKAQDTVKNITGLPVMD